MNTRLAQHCRDFVFEYPSDLLSLGSRWSRAWGFKSHWDTPNAADASPSTDQVSDQRFSREFYRLTGIFMLQDPDCGPARGSESSVGVATRRPLLRRREHAKSASQSSCHC
jgi:hypothetical protein